MSRRKVNWHRVVSRLWWNLWCNMSNYPQLLQQSAASKPVVSSGFVSPEKPTLQTGTPRWIWWHTGVQSLWLLAHLIAALTARGNPHHARAITSQGSTAPASPAPGNEDLMIGKLLWPRRAPCQSVWMERVWICGAQFHMKTWSSGKSFCQMPISSVERSDFWHCWFRRLFAITLEIQVLCFFPYQGHVISFPDS